jgi:hypothetical protein
VGGFAGALGVAVGAGLGGVGRAQGGWDGKQRGMGGLKGLVGWGVKC